jgi:hypothetical protein
MVIPNNIENHAKANQTCALLRSDEFMPIPWSTPAAVRDALTRRVISLKRGCWSNPVIVGGEAYVVRLASIENAQALAELHARSFPGYPYDSIYTKEYHERCCSDSNADVIRLAMYGRSGNVVAAGALGISTTELQAELEQVVVDPAYKGNGLCTSLVSGLTMVGRQLGLHRLYANARTRSPGMQRALWHEGYAPVGSVTCHAVYHAEGASMEPMVTMELWLVPRCDDIDKAEDQWMINADGSLLRLGAKED